MTKDAETQPEQPQLTYCDGPCSVSSSATVLCAACARTRTAYALGRIAEALEDLKLIANDFHGAKFER